ncbi:MAG: hypothetical protein WC860_00805 [Candidatus Margulisiibacteriota bacterium]|jgi:hypothetical protein
MQVHGPLSNTPILKKSTNTPPPAAAKTNPNLAAIKASLATGIEIDQITEPSSGKTLLLQSFSQKNWDGVIYLLHQGADSKIKDNSNKNLFQQLLTDPNIPTDITKQIITLLIITKALDLDTKDPATNLNPLEAAIQSQNCPAIERLLDRGADTIDITNTKTLQKLNTLGASNDPEVKLLFQRILNIISRNQDCTTDLIKFYAKQSLNQIAFFLIKQDILSNTEQKNVLMDWLKIITDSNLSGNLFLNFSHLLSPQETVQTLNLVVNNFNSDHMMNPKAPTNPVEKALINFMQKFFKSTNPAKILTRIFLLNISPPVDDLAAYFFNQCSAKEKKEMVLTINSRTRNILVLATQGQYFNFINSILIPYIEEQPLKNPPKDPKAAKLAAAKNKDKLFHVLLSTPDKSKESALTAAMKIGHVATVFQLSHKAMLIKSDPTTKPLEIKTSFGKKITIGNKDTYPRDKAGHTPFFYFLAKPTQNLEIIENQIIFFVVNKFLENSQNMLLIKNILTNTNLTKEVKEARLKECFEIFLAQALGIKDPLKSKIIQALVNTFIEQFFLFNNLPLSDGIIKTRLGRNTSLQHLMTSDFSNILERTSLQISQKLKTQPENLQTAVYDLFKPGTESFTGYLEILGKSIVHFSLPENSTLTAEDYPTFSATLIRLDLLIKLLEKKPEFETEVNDLKKEMIMLKRFLKRDPELLKGQGTIK